MIGVLHKYLFVRSLDRSNLALLPRPFFKVKCELYDTRDEDAFFTWPAYETKDETEVPKMAPVSEFAHELRSEVKKYFEKEAKRRGVPFMDAIKATPARWALMLTWFAIFACTLPSFVAGEWWTLIGTPFTYWIMGVNTYVLLQLECITL